MAFFSKRGLDFGTRTLLEALDMNKISGSVLDFLVVDMVQLVSI